MKVVINACYGSFQLSAEACRFLGVHEDSCGYQYTSFQKRTDPKLVECVSMLGERANGMFSELKVVEIPDDIEFYIDEFDGRETIHEKHRIWR